MSYVEAGLDEKYPDNLSVELEIEASPQLRSVALVLRDEWLSTMKTELADEYAEGIDEDMNLQWHTNGWQDGKGNDVVRSVVYSLYDGKALVGMLVVQERRVD